MTARMEEREAYLKASLGWLRANLDESVSEDLPKPLRQAAKYAIKQGLFYKLQRYQTGVDYASLAALKFAERHGFELWDLSWEEQKKIDENRSILHLEHPFTGTMFEEALLKLHRSGKLDADSVVRLVRDNYRTAWILKEEDRRPALPKSKRGDSLQSALTFYRKAEIELVYPDLSPVFM